MNFTPFKADGKYAIENNRLICKVGGWAIIDTNGRARKVSAGPEWTSWGRKKDAQAIIDSIINDGDPAVFDKFASFTLYNTVAEAQQALRASQARSQP